MKSLNILLNGVGRIGKAILKIASSNKLLNIVAINELNSNIQNIAYNINYDSTYGRINDMFETENDTIKNTTHTIKIYNFDTLDKINLDNVDIIIDSSGTKVNILQLKTLPVKAIFLTHPNKDADINLILGVNETNLDIKKHKIISTSSCNATALLPLLNIINDTFGIQSGDITTIHPLLNHQKTLDSGCIDSSNRDIKCNFEFGRSSTQNIIPSQTTTVTACSYVLPYINHNLLSSSSLRVPTSTVGVINVVLNLQKQTTLNEISNILYKYEQKQKFDIIKNNTAPLVSTDFQKESFTTIIDHRFIELQNKNLLKIVVWYDNEWGYASKVVDIVEYFIKQINKYND